MMKLLLCLSLLVAVARTEVVVCEQQKNCIWEEGCICSSKTSPLPVNATPQFVVLTFDDAVTKLTYTDFYEKILPGRVNPDGNPITATFFVPHEYTDYECVNKLYKAGHEIGTHSITKNYQGEYWSKATVDTLVSEFKGQKEIISQYANIPIKHIVGVRTPQLLLNGDNSFTAYNQSGLKFDSSWTSRSENKWFPYTLDKTTQQTCIIGTCPENFYPGFFVNPINNLVDDNENQCNSLLGCDVKGTASEISTWLYNQFNKTYTAQRAPFKLLINQSWLSIGANLDGLNAFLDQLAKDSNVFLVTESKLIEWMLKPVALEQYTAPVDVRDAACNPINCQLQKEEELRYMMSCSPCPDIYPWLGNPGGVASTDK